MKGYFQRKNSSAAWGKVLKYPWLSSLPENCDVSHPKSPSLFDLLSSLLKRNIKHPCRTKIRCAGISSLHVPDTEKSLQPVPWISHHPFHRHLGKMWKTGRQGSSCSDAVMLSSKFLGEDTAWSREMEREDCAFLNMLTAEMWSSFWGKRLHCQLWAPSHQQLVGVEEELGKNGWCVCAHFFLTFPYSPVIRRLS